MIERESSHITEVKILDVEKRYRNGPKHYVYVIQVTWANPTNIFIIYRRYAQFFDLQCKLLDIFAEVPTPTNQMKSQFRQIPFLPGKIIFGRSQIRQIALERKHTLNIYCQKLISLPEQISRSRPVLDFFRPSADDVKTPVQLRKEIRKSPVLAISQPTNLPTYRCVEDFNALDQIELSLKKNTRVQVIQKHLNGWWFVQLGDRKGFVPGAFLEVVDDRGQMRMSIPQVGNFLVNHNYTATDRDDISLEKGSFVTVIEKCYTGWWLVKFHDKIGQFPAVYLTSCEGRTVPEPTPPSVETIIQHEQSEDDDDDDDDDHSVGDDLQITQIEIFYVHTDYNDTVGDCMSLKRGDAIEVHHQHDSGWWLGRKLNSVDDAVYWIPSAFLQKEPLPSIDPIESIPTENIYQNISQCQKTIEIVQPIKKPPIVNERKPIVHSPAPVSQKSDDKQCLSTKVSVRDLVKKFNQPSG